MVGSSEEFIREVNTSIYDFLWKGRDKIKRNVMIADYNNGGLKMIDIASVIKAQKIIWIKRYCTKYDHPWKDYLSYHINKLGGECIFFGGVEIRNTDTPNFYLECINEINRYIDNNLDDFPHTRFHQSIWHNKTVQVQKKCIFFKELCKFGIKQIKDVFNPRGEFKAWNEIHGASGALFLQWYGCVNALRKANINKGPDMIDLCNSSRIIDKISTLKHKFIYQYFINDIASERPTNEFKLVDMYNFENIEYVYTLPFNVCMNSRQREFQFRCIKDIVYLNERLFKMNLVTDDLCSLCMLAKETAIHFFVECNISHDLWKMILDHFNVFSLFNIEHLTVKDIMYGVLIDDVCNPKVKLMNHIIILCKKYLYNCRMLNSKPHFNEFISHVLHTRNIEHHIAKANNKLNTHFAKWDI